MNVVCVDSGLLCRTAVDDLWSRTFPSCCEHFSGAECSLCHLMDLARHNFRLDIVLGNQNVRSQFANSVVPVWVLSLRHLITACVRVSVVLVSPDTAVPASGKAAGGQCGPFVGGVRAVVVADGEIFVSHM